MACSNARPAVIQFFRQSRDHCPALPEAWFHVEVVSWAKCKARNVNQEGPRRHRNPGVELIAHWLLLWPDGVCGALNEGLDLLNLLPGQLAGEVRHALGYMRPVKNKLFEL